MKDPIDKPHDALFFPGPDYHILSVIEPDLKQQYY
ncbi:unnamed protein product, partial [marine sediment metagenome]